MSEPSPREKPRVKLCGTGSVEDAQLAEKVGADFVGVCVGVSFSERNRTPEQARAVFASVSTPGVALFFNMPVGQTADLFTLLGAEAAQLLGNETPEQTAELKQRIRGEVWKSIFLPPKLPPEQESADDSSAANANDLKERMRRYADAGADKLLLDTAAFTGGKFRFGGTGLRSDWKLCRELIEEAPVPVFLSGGIRPENAAEAVRIVQPYGVDLCSGVEAERGRRDPKKTAALMRALNKKAS